MTDSTNKEFFHQLRRLNNLEGAEYAVLVVRPDDAAPEDALAPASLLGGSDLNYRGSWDAAGGVFPDIAGLSPKDYYVAVSDGVADGRTHSRNGRIVYNGGSSGGLDAWDYLPPGPVPVQPNSIVGEMIGQAWELLRKRGNLPSIDGRRVAAVIGNVGTGQVGWALLENGTIVNPHIAEIENAIDAVASETAEGALRLGHLEGILREVVAGFAFAVTDSQGRVGFGIRADGTIESPHLAAMEADAGSRDVRIAALEADKEISLSQEPGIQYQNTPVAAAIRSAHSGRAGLLVLSDGRLVNPHVAAMDQRLDQHDTRLFLLESSSGSGSGGVFLVTDRAGGELGVPLRITGTSDGTIECWGDSMTQGAASGAGTSSYPSQLQSLLGTPVNNRGVGGEWPDQIYARMIRVEVDPRQALTPGAVATLRASSPLNWRRLRSDTADTSIITLSNLDKVAQALWVEFRLDGELLAVTDQPASAESWEAEVRLPDSVAGPITTRVKTDADERLSLFWLGRNHIPFGPGPAIRFTRMAVAQLKGLAPRYLVLSIHNQADEPAGTDAYGHVATANRVLEATYDDRFVNTRQACMDWALANGTATDLNEVSQGLIPGSLRSDAIHLNESGNSVVAQAVVERLQMLGWVA